MPCPSQSLPFSALPALPRICLPGCSKGAGSACLLKPQRMQQIVRSMSSVLSCPLTFKMRKVRVWASGYVVHQVAQPSWMHGWRDDLHMCVVWCGVVWCGVVWCGGVR